MNQLLRPNTRSLTIGYITGLSLIALITISAQVLIQISLRRQADDSTLINIAGRQRMLSQRIAKNAGRLDQAPDEATLAHWMTELEESADLWVESHAALEQGSDNFDFDVNNSLAITALFREIEPHFQAISAAADCILADYRQTSISACTEPAAAYQQQIFEHEEAYLILMDSIVFQYDREARAQVNRLILIEGALMLITLTVLGLEAMLIFRPATTKIEHTLTDLQETRNSLARIKNQLEAIFDHSGDVILLLDRDLTILDANSITAEVFGQQKHEYLNTPLTDFLPEADANSMHAAAEMIRSTKTERQLDVEIRRDVSHFNGEIKLSPILDEMGELMYLVGTIRDVTLRKQAEQTLRIALQSERELSELRSRIVSIASHEFRTPLAAIKVTAEALLHHRDRVPEESIEQKLTRIVNQVNHMDRVTEDMLQFTKLDTSHVDFKREVDNLNALCLDVVHEFELQKSYKDRVVFSSNREVIPYPFNSQLMRQSLNNLLHNALKYSAEDTKVMMRLNQHPDSILIEIEDQGIGIPQDDLQRLFEPFHRASNVGAIRGTGLGLSITKQAIEKHGGEIFVDSQPGSGSTFKIYLPMAE